MTDIPDIEISGAVYRMSMQTDAKGAVLVAYTKDPETGRIGRSFIRFDLAGVDYLRRRLGTGAELGTSPSPETVHTNLAVVPEPNRL
ncbi:hypothetical protein [Streptomyces sp. WZ-12]|uniref:hypothetical protein n=1 Tax=Streptomyces sp. WZ-12 TaxID=3030210 RepID=UPI002380CACF|nr:hypothetical protein [Streptomyces sp. WZ-12]